MTLLDESEALHASVRAFARAESAENFDELALAIARFQARWSASFARLVEAHGSSLDGVDAIPAVPVETFRMGRVAVHSPELDRLRFRTSGTTAAATGEHCFRTTETYREVAVRHGELHLCSAWAGPRVVVALAPEPGAEPSSSLGFMMRLFIEAFDGRELSMEPRGLRFDADAPERWLVGPAGPDVQGLTRAARIASQRGEPLLVLATSLALVALLEVLDGGRLRAPERTVVMHTGGFKGRRREVAPDELRRSVAHAFGIPEAQVVGEYGMTELTSQLYEATLPGATVSGEAGVFFEPPWLRVTPVDPTTLLPAAGGRGIARIVDLGNVDSAVAIVTQDVVSRAAGGIRLHGRRQGASDRGCSLAVESLLWGPAR
jgi:hypothetical protein